MERHFLKAKRRYYSNSVVDPEPSQKPLNSHNQPCAGKLIGTTKTAFKKNIASERMKRLRESLRNDVDESITIGDLSPAKRFAPNQCKISEQSQYKSPKSTNCKLYRKNFPPSTSASPRSSVSKRLMNAATSTPEQMKETPIKYFRSDENLSFSQFVHNSTVDNGHIEFLSDADSNIIDLSNSSNSYRDDACLSSAKNISFLCQVSDSTGDELENMDWSPVTEQQLLSDLRGARENLYQSQHQQPPYLLNNTRSSVGGLNSKNIYVVVDTNIFIDKLQTVINVMHIVYTDNSQPVIYAPWMVVQELEYFKHGYSLSVKHPVSKLIQARCRKAIKFINECLIAGKQNFKGQPVQKAAEIRLIGNSPDDSILASCMQLDGEGCEVILLSSDINLRNKALISNIKAFSPDDIMKELKRKSVKKDFNFVEAISKKLSLICSFILHFEIKAHYGEQEYENKSFKDLPWQFRDCIGYLSDNYDSVFRRHVPKHCLKVVDDLREMLFTSEETVNDVKFMELCLSLLIYLQTGLPKYDANIQNTIQEIKEIEHEYLS